MSDKYNTIVLKSSEEPGKVPSVTDLLPGELAINIADGKLYTLKLTEGQYEVIQIGAAQSVEGGGGSSGGGATTIQNLVWQSPEGTSNEDHYPAEGYYDYGQSMIIIRASELGTGAKMLHGLEIEVNGYTPGYTFNNQTLKLAHTSDLEFGSNVKTDLTNINGLADLTSVKADFTWTINSSGYQTIDFDTNFEYNGTDSLLIIWENRDGSWNPGFGWAECHFDNTYADSWYKHQDDSYPSSSYGTADQSYRPNIRLKY